MRRKKAAYYNKKLSKIGQIKIPKEISGNRNVYQLYTIELKDAGKRGALQKFLAEKRIMAKIYFAPVHLKTIYSRDFGCQKGDLPVTEGISEKVLTLPFYPHMPEKEINFVARQVKKFFDF